MVNVGDDRDYVGLDVFFHEILLTDKVNVRAFYLRVRESGGYEIRESCPQTPGGEEWPTVDLLSFKHHMRWLETCADMLAEVKRDWKCISKAHSQVFAVEGWGTK